MVTNRQHAFPVHGPSALKQRRRGAGSQITGACVAHVKAAQRLTIACTLLAAAAPAAAWASIDVPPTATSFAYSASHPAKPLPDAVFETIAETDPEGLGLTAFSLASGDDVPILEMPVEPRIAIPRQLSRKGLCSAVASVARANDLPIPFFANLIWQESSFNTKTISRAGAQGIAQFMPKTAVQFGLINPFEPIHALNVAGKFVRDLYGKFGNYGLAAAAYNAGPRRVADWIAKRGELPSETRNYVIRITGRPADQWISGELQNDPESALMPAQAPCVEVADAVKAQTKTVRLAKLMKELTAAAATARDNSVEVAKDQPDPALVAAAEADPRWPSRALRMVNDVVKRLTAKVGRKVLAQMAAKSATQPRVKLAMLELSASDHSPIDRSGGKGVHDNGAANVAERDLARAEGKTAGNKTAGKMSAKIGTGAKTGSRADLKKAGAGAVANAAEAARPGIRSGSKPVERATAKDTALAKGDTSVREAKKDEPKRGEPKKAESVTTGSAKADDTPQAESKQAKPEAGKHETRRHRRAPRRPTVAFSNLDQIF
jgi:soluble lytic murein transglycosylase-like protein